MTGETIGMFEPTAAEEREGETDTAERGDDPTPRGVIRAALEAAICHDIEEGPVVGCDPSDTHGGMESGHVLQRGWYGATLRVLDVGAGYGAWSSELRRLANRQGWPVRITGVELHAARERHGRKWCDEWRAGVWQGGRCQWCLSNLGQDIRDGTCTLCPDCEGTASDLGSFDLAIGNPPFDELTGPKGAKRPPELCMPAVLLRHAPAVLLLHTTTAFQKSVAGRASWRANPPAATWLVPGGVGFRGPGNGNASDCYQVTLWLRGQTGPCSTYLLDDLTPAERSWTVPPGTEQPSACESCGGVGAPADAEEWAGEVCGDCHGSGLDPHGDLPAAPGWQP